MRIITKSRLLEFGENFSQARKPLAEWFSVVSKAQWDSFDDLRKIYSSADQVKVKSGHTVTVFNIGGNKFRLIAAIHYNNRKIFILSIMPHDEYEKDVWKETF